MSSTALSRARLGIYFLTGRQEAAADATKALASSIHNLYCYCVYSYCSTTHRGLKCNQFRHYSLTKCVIVRKCRKYVSAKNRKFYSLKRPKNYVHFWTV